MNHNEHPDDGDLTLELHNSLLALATPARPPLAAIASRARAHQRRHLAGFAGLGVTGVAAATALALSLAGVLGAAPLRSTGTIRTAAFSLTSNADGTDTLTLTNSQMFDPAALQQALAQHRIPALVKTGTYCSSSPAAPDLHAIGVLSIRLPFNSPRHTGLMPLPRAAKPGDFSRIIDRTVTVIDPAAMPPGTELFFGYATNAHLLFADLIYTKSYSCSSQLPAAP